MSVVRFKDYAPYLKNDKTQTGELTWNIFILCGVMKTVQRPMSGSVCYEGQKTSNDFFSERNPIL
jgi:hypothetical protein